jgi:seryl-tRNA synthetase
MLDAQLIRKRPEIVEASLRKRNFEFDISKLLNLDEERRSHNQ